MEAEPAVEVDQAPEEQGPDRDHQAGERLQLRHPGGGSGGPQRNATPLRAREAAARTLESGETASAAVRQTRQPVPRSPAPRTPPRRSPCCSARLRVRCHSPGLPPSRWALPGRPRPAPERRAADYCEVRTEAELEESRPSSARSKAPFKTDKLWGESCRLNRLDTVGGRAIHIWPVFISLLAPPQFKAFFLDPWIMGRMGGGSSKRLFHTTRKISLFIPKAHLKVLLFSSRFWVVIWPARCLVIKSKPLAIPGLSVHWFFLYKELCK